MTEPFEQGHTRRCIVTGRADDPAGLVRFVLAPDGSVLPDIAGKLPGRGFWVTASRQAMADANAKAFARAARQPVTVPAGLPEQVEQLLARRCLDLVGLARRAGQAIAGFEKVREWLQGGNVRVLLAASDGSADGRGKLARLAKGLPIVAMFSSAELSLALGRENVVHAALASGGLAERFLAETARLSGFRHAEPVEA